MRDLALSLALFACACGSPTSSGTDAGAVDEGVTDGDVGDSAIPNGPDGPLTIADASIVHAPGGITITTEPDGTKVAQNLLSAIEGATSAVHVEMYLLTNTYYIGALKTLHDKGVAVEVVLNKTFPSDVSTSATNATSYTTLMSYGIGVHWAPTTTGFDGYTHEKAVIIDPGTANAQVWIMTMNLDTDAPKYNREYLALDVNAADVTEAEAIFQADYASTSITPTGNLIVAPSPQNNAQPALLQLINGATTSIDIEAEEYSSSGIEAAIATALQTKAHAGIAVRMVLEESTDSSQAAAVAALTSAGGTVVGYAYGGTALNIHAKAIVVDGAKAYIGSENLSGGSLGYNRELGVLVTEASEVAKISSAISTDFAGGTTYKAQ